MQPAPQALDIIRNGGCYKPTDRKAQDAGNNAADRPGDAPLQVHHRNTSARGNNRLEDDHSVDTHYRFPKPESPGQGSMSATLNCRKHKGPPKGKVNPAAVLGSSPGQRQFGPVG